MLDVSYSKAFKKDVKSCQKRGLDLALLQNVIDTLRIPQSLPPKNKVHNLVGNLKEYSECHIQPNWLLIYKADKTTLYLYRTGTHSDLFDE